MRANQKKGVFKLCLNFTHVLWRIATLFVFFSTSHVVLSAEVSEADAQSIIERGELIVEFHHFADQLVGDREVPRMRIYSDGTSLVYFPPYMVQSGYYVETLHSDQVLDLIRRIDASDLTSFDKGAVMADVALSEQSRRLATGLITYKSHVMMSKVTVYSVTAGLGAQRVSLDGPLTIEWPDLHNNNEKYGDEVPAIAKLDELIGHLDLLVDLVVGGS